MIEGTPLPVTDNPIDAAFWTAALRGELTVQRCSGCGMRRFPPRPMCPSCQSMELTWDVMTGKGHIWSFVIAHPPLLPTFAKVAPYASILVELDDDPTIRMVGNLIPNADGEINEVDPTTVAIGAPVSVVFQTVTPDVALPRWVLT